MEEKFIIEGRRIVNIEHLAKQRVCKSCGGCLHLLDIVKEKRYGLASMLTVRCQNKDCQFLNRVTTGKRHGSQNGPFVINSKSVLGK